MMNTAPVPFPKDKESMAVTQRTSSIHSDLSLTSATYATAVDVCTTMYGENPASAASIDRFYESSASIYENPVLTATSRSVIADIHQLSRQLSVIDVPRPIALVCTLFRLQPPRAGFLARNFDDPLFQALRVWTEISDICENESFDGHRKTIVEHTLNILVLPGIHREGYRAHPSGSSDSLITAPGASQTTAASQSHPHPHSPGLPIPGTSLTIPSPFHFSLHIITRLTFNEQGRITHHRDFWDVKDVMGLVPGASLAQWIGTRLAAKGLTYVASLWHTTPSSTAAARAGAAQPTSEHDAIAMEMGFSPVVPAATPALEKQ